MRLVKSPLRISIGGGGTDLPFYCGKKGGNLAFATIDKNVYITVNDTVDGQYAISLRDGFETAEELSHIKNDYVRNILQNLGLTNSRLNISSTSEVPGGTGLGSSGSFTVGLLKALESRSKKRFSKKQLAEKAFEIENRKIGDSCGKQDQYAAAFGGLKNLKINKNGDTALNSLNINEEDLKELEEKLMLFYTNERRYSEKILESQKEEMGDNPDELKKLDKIKELGQEIITKLEKGEISDYGKLLHSHWETKKQFSDKMTNPEIDKMYSAARKQGATGGKIVGAGGGGFLLLFAEKRFQDDIIDELKQLEARHLEFSFANKGCEVVYER